MKATRSADSYRRAHLDQNYDAIVIGSGIGGLTAAALLARHGRRRVLVLERHYTLGGYTHVFHRPDYEWDVGVHYIGDTAPGSLLRSLFDDITGGELQWADMGPVVERMQFGDWSFEYPKGKAALRAALVRDFPDEVAAIDRYFALVQETAASVQGFFATKALPRLLAAVLMPLAKRRFFRFSDRTTLQVLQELTSNKRLIGVLTGQWGCYGLPPSQSSFAIHALVTDHYFGGGAYPVGGAARIAETIAPVIEAAGGRLLVKAEVAEIVVENGRAVGVRMAEDGAVLRAPLVISDAGVPNTFGRLVPAPVAKELRLERAFQGTRPSVAHACLYVGLRGTTEELGLTPANLWVYPDEDHDRTYAGNGDSTAAPFAYVSFPSAKDPDFARRYPGRSAIDIMTFLPYDEFERWEDTRWHKRGDDYEALKQKLTDRLLEILYEHVPGARGAVDVAELSTPATTRHFTAHDHGEIYGLAHTPERFRNAMLRPSTPLRGLMLTGADIASGGVSGAMLGGALCASAILRRNLVNTAPRIVGATATTARAAA